MTAETQEVASAVFNHTRFVGLWAYRSFGKEKQFCVSVIIGGQVCETEMHNTWRAALLQAREMLLYPDETS